MNKGKIEKKQGITLIALVISIIVLLILAGVALNLVLGENGITERAVNVGKEYDIAGAKEQVEALVASYASEFYEKKYISGNTDSANVGDYIATNLTEDSIGNDYALAKSGRMITITNTKTENTEKFKIKDDGSIEW